jgi:hypothetical protein
LGIEARVCFVNNNMEILANFAKKNRNKFQFSLDKKRILQNFLTFLFQKKNSKNNNNNTDFGVI